MGLVLSGICRESSGGGEIKPNNRAPPGGLGGEAGFTFYYHKKGFLYFPELGENPKAQPLPCGKQRQGDAFIRDPVI